MPQHKESLDVNALKKFLLAAKEQGYNTVSISGGEPFLYNDLAELLEFSKSVGFKNAVASNGMLLDNNNSNKALDFVDIMALSIDGEPELHNKIRGSKRAFKKMLDGIEVVKSKEIPFGFIHTVTNDSWQSLLWLGEFAHERGAKLLQLHPLEMYGRAIEEMQGFGMDQLTLHKVFVLASYLKSKYDSEIFVQLDLLHKDSIKEDPKSVNVLPDCAEDENLADRMNTLIVDEKGDIVPVGYGFSSKYRVGNLAESNDYDGMLEKYMDTKMPALDQFFKESYEKIIEDEDRDLVNWNELVIRWSRNGS
jgi:MoaA/NifB/PqqE/SkfB family radical SAM enzyme